jgi:hypothetical protein
VDEFNAPGNQERKGIKNSAEGKILQLYKIEDWMNREMQELKYSQPSLQAY